jgi:hypothetical protein
MNFTKNIGTTDRAIRGVVGIVLIALAITGNLTSWGWIGIVPLVTALLSWCPADTLLGFKTWRITDYSSLRSFAFFAD